MLSFDINWLAVLVAAVAAFVLGGFWYSDALFGKQWRKGAGISDADVKKAREKGFSFMLPNMIGGFLSMFVTAFFLVNLLAWVGVGSVGEALEFTFWLWLGFFAMQMLGSIFWDGKKFDYYLINVIYVLLMFMIMSAIVSAWV